MRLLRHANIHLAAAQLTSKVQHATWDGPNGLQEFTIRVFIVSNLTASIGATENVKHYTSSELDAMITWLEAEQRIWGIHHTLLRCAEVYAAAVVKLL